MFIDEFNEMQCSQLYSMIDNHPVKWARIFFPDRPKNYVKYALLIKHYAINKFTAFGCAKTKSYEAMKKYTSICADIWMQLPAEFRSLPFETTSLWEITADEKRFCKVCKVVELNEAKTPPWSAAKDGHLYYNYYNCPCCNANYAEPK